MEPTTNPYKKTGSASKEAKLQVECVTWYRDVWYRNRKGMWGTFNEGQGVNKKLAMGMLPGVSDIILKDARGMGGLELKFPGEDHNVAHVIKQAEWILETCDFGGFIDNLYSFQQTVQGAPCWIDPQRVINYLRTLKTKTFVWDSSKF